MCFSGQMKMVMLEAGALRSLVKGLRVVAWPGGVSGRVLIMIKQEEKSLRSEWELGRKSVPNPCLWLYLLGHNLGVVASTPTPFSSRSRCHLCKLHRLLWVFRGAFARLSQPHPSAVCVCCSSCSFCPKEDFLYLTTPLLYYPHSVIVLLMERTIWQHRKML